MFTAVNRKVTLYVFAALASLMLLAAPLVTPAHADCEPVTSTSCTG